MSDWPLVLVRVRHFALLTGALVMFLTLVVAVRPAHSALYYPQRYIARVTFDGNDNDYIFLTSAETNFPFPSIFAQGQSGWVAYEYWFYYPHDYKLYNTMETHEHDWEIYYVYFYKGSPEWITRSAHGGYRWDRWTSFSFNFDGRTIILSLPQVVEIMHLEPGRISVADHVPKWNMGLA